MQEDEEEQEAELSLQALSTSTRLGKTGRLGDQAETSQAKEPNQQSQVHYSRYRNSSKTVQIPNSKTD